jgi:hypothetical protein
VKKQMDVTKPIMMGVGLIVVMVAMLAMFPTVIAQVEAAVTDADTWNFTGASGTESLLGLVPFGWGAGIAIFGIVGAFSLAQGLRGKGE